VTLHEPEPETKAPVAEGEEGDEEVPVPANEFALDRAAVDEWRALRALRLAAC
jgi:hypothetical protein